MEKYFKSYEEAATYVIENVLIKFEKNVIQIKELQMSDKEYFYKLIVEPYKERTDPYPEPYPWITTTPAVIPYNGQSQVWYETKPQEPDKYDKYRITCGNGSSSAMGDTTPLGHNPYQE